MKANQVGSMFGQVLLALAVFTFQLLSMHYNQQFVQELKWLEYGIHTGIPVVLSIIMGMASGFCAALLILRNCYKKELLPGVLLSLLISCLGLGLKIYFGISGVLPFSALRPVFSDFFEWLVYSQIPSFWNGLVLGWLIIKKRRD